MPQPCAAAPTAADPLLAGAGAALDRRLDPASRGPVAVALSGGGDSLALLQLAAGWCARTRRPLLALTVDHGLNPESARWTQAAGEAAACVGAAWRALGWEGPKPATGLPAAARAARHRLLAEAARAAGARVILTGHTFDDALEGELMREADAPALGRLAEWSPSPAWPQGRGIFLLRPLLGQRRAALRDWLRTRGLEWLDDPANDDPRFARARARAAVSLLPQEERVAAERSDEGTTAGSAPSSVASGDTVSPAETRVSGDGRIVLVGRDLDARLLSAVLLCAAGTDRPPRGEPLARLLMRLRGEEDVEATLAGARVVARGGSVQVGRESGRGGLRTVGLPPGVPTVWDGRYEITAREPGWSAAPLAGRMARLSPGDRQGLKPIPAWARPALPVLVHVSGRVRLPGPFGDGPAEVASLAAARLAAACGLIAREGDIEARSHGAGDLLTLCWELAD